MHVWKTVLCFVLGFIIFVTSTAMAAPIETVHNRDFEMSLFDDRPMFWYVGFMGEPLPTGSGEWDLDEAIFSKGKQSLRLSTFTDEAYFFSQAADGNTNLLTGVEVFVSADVRVEPGAQAIFAVVATNPELPENPDYGIGVAGETMIITEDTDGEFIHLTGSFVATAPAQAVAVMLMVTGVGAVWFDNVSVKWDQPVVGDMPDPPAIEPVFDQRDFGWGFVNENPRNISEYAQQDIVSEAALLGADTATLFFHVRYNQLTGQPLLDGFEQMLLLDDLAREKKMDRIVVFDFTHDSIEGLGDLNPLPDGTSPGSFEDPLVREAMQNELLAIVEQVQPKAVMIGIEINFFYEKHPEWWETFVDWYFTMREEINFIELNCRVSVYVTYDFYVNDDGELRYDNINAFADLASGMDLIAFSVYRFADDISAGRLTPGMFAKMTEVIPDTPIALPEFGVASVSQPFALDEQDGQVEVLQRILDEVAEAGCLFATLYSLYDWTYLGVDPWFQDAFGSIGLYDLSYSPKLSAAWFKMIAEMKPVADEDTQDDDTGDDDMVLPPEEEEPKERSDANGCGC